jgi:hypothetical protein
MAGQRPISRIIYKEQGDSSWQELASAWKLAQGENCSITLDVDAINRAANGASKIKALLVPNKPRPSQPANDRAANGNRSEPTRGPQRTRRATNDCDVA